MMIDRMTLSIKNKWLDDEGKNYIHYSVAEIMAERHIMYNDCLDYIERLEKSGQVFVIRPQHPNDVRRIERDKVRMKALYDQGYQEAEALYEDLMNYLNS